MKGKTLVSLIVTGTLVIGVALYVLDIKSMMGDSAHQMAESSPVDLIDPAQYHADLDTMAAHVASLNGQLQQIRNQMPVTEHASDRERPARRNDQTIEQVYAPTQDDYVSDAESDPEHYATPSGESFEGERQRTQEAVSELDHALATEDTDPHWAPHMEDAIYTAAGQTEFAGGQIGNVVCRSSFCRLNIDLTDVESETQFLQELVQAAGLENVDAFYSREERADGGLAMTVFISREGQPLPGQMRQ